MSQSLKNAIAANVPRYIKHIQDRGGVSSEEWLWLQCEEENPDYPMHLISRADEYLLYPKDQKTFMHGLFVLTLALAIMSFVPGGVRFLGKRFSSQSQDFVIDEREDVPATITGSLFETACKLAFPRNTDGQSKT